MMKPLTINSYTLTCAAGTGISAIRSSILGNRSGLSDKPWHDCELQTWLGRVTDLDESRNKLQPEWESRNNRLAHLGIHQDQFAKALGEAITRFGTHRCGLVIGTSTSSIGRSEQGYRELDPEGRFTSEFQQDQIHDPHAPGAFLANLLDIEGPCMTVSTACSSSSKAFAVASRWLQQDIVDVVIVGGVDSLCQSVIHGFNSLQLVDNNLCKPFDLDRGGINLGEAAGFVLVSREPLQDSGIRLLGYGESSDAYHMSSAHPDGLGAQLAMQAAIERSARQFSDLDYVNLHGTGTRSNDSIESKICGELLAPNTLCSSTKGLTGHTLGTAGICEAILTIDAIRTSIVPGNINTQNPEFAIASKLALTATDRDITLAMSNSFGFGGNNSSLIFGAA
jgi:3-oxoacyl-[acyl-carrier-protein] synthase-1